ncbi:unnamed protein product [Polarella glacialis]|uniref:Mei2-like C-terminal RNA recognition motif domain-containing protein n=1 Tax=Polarella glacialis TaxID=89957 RepID=A0A813GVJ4_POLGL|nr:unnamed protein product [Polarella glacialis]
MSMPSIPGAIMAFQGLPVPDQRYSQDPITSFMIRNIPCSLTRDSVKSQVDRNGFSGLYDNFQLPLGRKSSTGLRRANLGYAFINFLHAEHAARFRDIFDGYSFTGTVSTKVCQVQVSRFQGQQAYFNAKSRPSDFQTHSVELIARLGARDPTESQLAQSPQPDRSHSCAAITLPERQFQNIGTFQAHHRIASAYHKSHGDPTSTQVNPDPAAMGQLQLPSMSSDQWHMIREDFFS